MKLVDKTILITGGTSGIGYALAKSLLGSGNTVIVTGRNLHALEQARLALRGLHVMRSDVSDPAAITRLRDEVLGRFPALDVLINNAGIMRKLDFTAADELVDVTLDVTADVILDKTLYPIVDPTLDITREIDINLSGPIRMTQQFLPHLQSMSNAAIVNVSSGLAFVPFPQFPVYSATKAALHAFSQALRVQLEHTSVRVIEVAPPGVKTPLFKNAFEGMFGMKTAMDADSLAAVVIAAIEAGQDEIRPGISQLLMIMSRIAPRFALKKMARAGRKE